MFKEGCLEIVCLFICLVVGVFVCFVCFGCGWGVLLLFPIQLVCYAHSVLVYVHVYVCV